MNVRPINREKQRELSVLLKALHDVVLSEPVPQCMDELVKKLK
jgi:hypothetical protein